MNWKNTIIRYFKGDLGSDEVHQLEREGLDDALLGDALEGIHSYQQSDIERKMKILDSRLDKARTNRQPALLIRMWPYAAAASVALILLFGLPLMNRQSVKDGSPTTAVQTESMEEIEAAPNDDLAVESSFEELQDQLDDWSTSEATSEDELPAFTSDEQKRAKRTIKSNDLKGGQESDQSAGSIEDPPSLDNQLAAVDDAIQQQESSQPKPALAPTASYRSNAITLEEVADEVEAQALLEPQDTTLAYPIIGREKVTQMNIDWRDSIKPDLFMRGIRSGGKVVVQFELDDEGRPIRLTFSPDMGDFMNEKVGDFVRSTGKWVSPENQRILTLTVFY